MTNLAERGVVELPVDLEFLGLLVELPGGSGVALVENNVVPGVVVAVEAPLELDVAHPGLVPKPSRQSTDGAALVLVEVAHREVDQLEVTHVRRQVADLPPRLGSGSSQLPQPGRIAVSRSISSSTGSIAMRFCQFALFQSRFSMRRPMGPPMVRPCRTPLMWTTFVVFTVVATFEVVGATLVSQGSDFIILEDPTGEVTVEALY